MHAKRGRWARALSLALLGCLLTAAALPDFRYISIITFNITGLLGKIIDIATPDEITQEVLVSGNKMLTKSKHVWTLTDLDDETITTINHRDKTATVITFEQMRQLLRQRKAEAGQQDAQTDEKPDATVTLHFSLERTGTFDTINNMRAERVLLTILADVEKTQAEGETPPDEAASEDAGQFVVVMELWMSDAVDGYLEVQDFQRRYAQKLNETMFDEGQRQGILEALKTIVGNDERLKASLERAQQEAAGLDGMAVRTTTHVVTVPPGMEYDPDQVFGENKETKKKKGGLGGFAKKLAQQAAGLDAGNDEKPPAQRTLVTTTDNREGFSRATIAPSTFDPLPAGYTQKAFVVPQGGQ